MDCPECGKKLEEAQDGGGFCSACRRFFLPGQIHAEHTDSQGNRALSRLLRELPYPLALLLSEYLQESNPYVRLHRMCDAAEMAVRFLTITCLAEIERQKGVRNVGARLRDTLVIGIPRPTFGVWVSLLRASCEELSEPLLIPEFRRLNAQLMDLVSPLKATQETGLLSLRNSIAHERFTTERSQLFLENYGHRQRFERFWTHDASVLVDLLLIGFATSGGCYLLRGVPDISERFEAFDPGKIVPTDRANASQWPPGTVLLLLEGRPGSLSLSPLHTYGPVLRRREDGSGRHDVVLPDDVNQVYARSRDHRLQYTALHDEVGSGDGSEPLQRRFHELFPLTEWRHRLELEEEAKLYQDEARGQLPVESKRFRFRDFVSDFRSKPFVGRSAEIACALGWLDTHLSGAGLIIGQPGMGKTALMVHLSVEVARERREWLCFRHFFAAADGRCSVREFARGIWAQLAELGFETGALQEVLGEHELRTRLLEDLHSFAASKIGVGKAYVKLILLLDGLDELPKSDLPILELMARTVIPNVVWVLTGRPEPAILEGLPRDSALEWIFGEEGLRELDRQSVRCFLMEELDRCRYPLLAEEERRDKFLTFLTTEARSLPLYLRLLAEDLRQGRGQEYLDHPDRLPTDLSDYYDRLLAKLCLDAALKVLPDIVALLAIAKTPLSDGMLATLLKDHDLRRSADWESIFRRSMLLGHVLLRRCYVSEGVTGQTLYHGSFRKHLLDNERKPYDEFPMAPILQLARERVIRLCLDWRQWPEKSYERTYALQYGPAHLIESERWDELDRLITSEPDFLQAAATALGSVDALVSARKIARALIIAGVAHWDGLLNCGAKYCHLLEEIRGDPKALSDLIKQHEMPRLVDAIQIQPELYRGILMLAVTPLLIESGEPEMAQSAWQEGLKLVAPRLEKGLDSIEGYGAATTILVHALYGILSKTSVESPGMSPAKTSMEPPEIRVDDRDVSARKSIPWWWRLLATLTGKNLPVYIWEILFGSFGYFLFFVFLNIWFRIRTDFAGQSALGVFLVTGGLAILVLPLRRVARAVLQRRAKRIDYLLAQLEKGLEEIREPDQRRQMFSRLIPFAVNLFSLSPEHPRWRIYLPSWVGQQFALVCHDPKAASRLLLVASQFGDEVGDVLIGALRRLKPSETVAAIHSQLVRRACPGVGHLQVLRMMAATLDRLPDTDAFVAYLAYYAKVTPPRQRRDVTLISLLQENASPSRIGTAILSSLQRKDRPFRFVFRTEWAAQMAWTGVPAAVGKSEFDTRIFFLLCAPGFLTLSAAILVTLGWAMAGVVFTALLAGRVYDPYGLRRRICKASAVKCRSIITEVLNEPDLSLDAIWNCLRTGKFPLRAAWIVAPFVNRRMRETVYAQKILRNEAIEPSFYATYSIASLRRIISTLFKCGSRHIISILREKQLLGPNSFLYLIDDRKLLADRKLLKAVRKAMEPMMHVQPAKTFKAPEDDDAFEDAADKAELIRHFPVTPVWCNLLLGMVLGISGTVFWWLLVGMFPEDARFWFLSFSYGGLALIGTSVFLAVTPHGYAFIREKYWPPFPRKRPIQEKALAYQIMVGVAFLVLMIFWIVPAIRRAAANAGFFVINDDNTFWYLPIIPVWINGLLVPTLIAGWRGAGLFYPSKGELWLHRVFWTLFTVAAIFGLALFAHREIGLSFRSESQHSFERGDASFKKGDYDKAIQECNQAIRLGYRLTDVYSIRGMAHRGKGDFDQAIEDLTQAIRLDPANFRNYEIRAQSYSHEAKFAKAILDYQEAIRLNPEDANLYGNLAWEELLARQPKEAISASLAGLRIDPSQTWIKTNLAHGYLFDNQYDNALKVYNENRDKKVDNENGQTFAEVVLDDFKKLKQNGILHPDVQKIEMLYKAKRN